jgi:sarcosine oxidase
LAKRGVRVLGLEQFDIPHNKGSSHGFTRMIRTAYYEHSDYVPLVQRAFKLWAELEEQSLAKILHVTGGLYLGRPDGELVAGSLKASKTHNLSYELFQRHELLEKFPQFRVPDDWVGLYEYQAGFVVPELAISAHVDMAMRYGAEIHGNEPVVKWETDGAGATVTTKRENYLADQIVFCGGAWSDKLVRDLGVKLTVTRQVSGWVQPLRRDPFLLGVLPVWGIDKGDGTLYYGFPMMADNPGFKIAHHAPAQDVDPDTIDREPRPEDEKTFRPPLKFFLPGADGPLISMRICMYTSSPDKHFIVDRHPAHPRVTIACGFSGHGFKFASVIGQALAELALDQRSDLPIRFLGFNRFC